MTRNKIGVMGCGMVADYGNLPAGEDGLIALRIARAATEQAIADRR